MSNQLNAKSQCHVAMLALLLTLVYCPARSADWKYIGKSTIKGIEYYAFYDNDTEERQANRHLIVWVKFIEVAAIDTIPINRHDKLYSLIVDKLGKYYVPPFILTHADTSWDNNFNIIALETIATTLRPAVKIQIRYELDCMLKRLRTLSYIFYKENGESESSSDLPSGWSPVAPETFAEEMSIVLCR